MKSYAKVLSVLLGLAGLPAIAAEAPAPTFSIWGEPGAGPLDYYNVIKNLSGQEFAGFTVNCVDGGTGPTDNFVLKVQIHNATNGALRYVINPSIDSPNANEGVPECQAGSIGYGIAVSGRTRVIVWGMTEANHALIYGYDADTGVQLYKKEVPLTDGDYSLAMPGNASSISAVGNFLNTRSDQIRVTYIKGSISPGPVELKITYYDVLTGSQMGSPIIVTVPTP